MSATQTSFVAVTTTIAALRARTAIGCARATSLGTIALAIATSTRCEVAVFEQSTAIARTAKLCLSTARLSRIANSIAADVSATAVFRTGQITKIDCVFTSLQSPAFTQFANSIAASWNRTISAILRASPTILRSTTCVSATANSVAANRITCLPEADIRDLRRPVIDSAGENPISKPKFNEMSSIGQ